MTSDVTAHDVVRVIDPLVKFNPAFSGLALCNDRGVPLCNAMPVEVHEGM